MINNMGLPTISYYQIIYYPIYTRPGKHTENDGKIHHAINR